MQNILEIDNTRRSTAVTCLRKYFYRYIKNITPATGSTSLRFGSTWHALMEGYYSSVITNGWNHDNITPAIALAKQVWEKETNKYIFYEDYKTLEAAYESFVEYLEKFQDDKTMMDVVSSERIFRIKMSLSDKEKFLYPSIADSEVFFTGKLDLETILSGMHWIMEFKTTGQPIQLQASRLQRSAQIIGYTYASKLLGNDVAGTLISMHQITSRKTKDGTYGKVTREFIRQPNVFSNADLEYWRQSYLSTCNRISHALATDHFPCEYDSCYQFGQCGFCRLCEQNKPIDEINYDGYIEEVWNVLETGASSENAPIIELEEHK